MMRKFRKLSDLLKVWDESLHPRDDKGRFADNTLFTGTEHDENWKQHVTNVLVNPTVDRMKEYVTNAFDKLTHQKIKGFEEYIKEHGASDELINEFDNHLAGLRDAPILHTWQTKNNLLTHPNWKMPTYIHQFLKQPVHSTSMLSYNELLNHGFKLLGAHLNSNSLRHNPAYLNRKS